MVVQAIGSAMSGCGLSSPTYEIRRVTTSDQADKPGADTDARHARCASDSIFAFRREERGRNPTPSRDRATSMSYFLLLREVLVANFRRLAFLAVLSGIASTAVLAVINRANVAVDSDVRASALFLLLLAVIIYSLSHRALLVGAAALAENTVDRLRISLEEKLRAAELLQIEKLDINRIYASISAEMQVLADHTVALALVAHSLLLVVITAVYLLFISVTAVVLAVAFTSLAACVFLRRSRQTSERLGQAFQLDAQLLSRFSDLIAGFKEVKLNASRAEELGSDIQYSSARVAAVRLNTRSGAATDLVLSQVAFYLLIGLMVFVVPMFTVIDRQTLAMITAGTLFLVGPIATVVAGIPVLQRVDSASKAILSVLHELPARPEISGHFRPVGFPEEGIINLTRVTFAYDSADESSFAIGPIDMEIKRDQLVLITGGNGSGKSTLLKLLTGLYLPTGGAITATVGRDGTRQELRLSSGPELVREDLVSYQNLFSAVFSDYHLFKKLYGIADVDLEEANKLLQLVELQHKVSIVDREFSDINLSSGQRKRLAMVALLLENRPICVVDEWAADQDKHFRDKFYFTILPMLLNKYKKTVIVVTHDIEYFKSERIPQHERFHMELAVDAAKRPRALLRKLRPGEDPFQVVASPSGPVGVDEPR
jgi:putative pyoverdin transport system ATP-binding/permease protein